MQPGSTTSRTADLRKIQPPDLGRMQAPMTGNGDQAYDAGGDMTGEVVRQMHALMRPRVAGYVVSARAAPRPAQNASGIEL